MHERVFICNCGIYSAGIRVPSLLVKAIDANKTVMIMND